MAPSSDRFGIVGKVIAGTYRVEAVVAEGGFGVVYRAHHKGFRAPVALKCLKIPGDLGEQHKRQFLEQFRSEAEVLFRLSALLPNIVRPLHVDAFQTRDGRFVPFLALEWLDGWTLDAVITQRAEQGRPPIVLETLVQLLTPVARALEQAHNLPGPTGPLSIVHRDMKPENLFVALVGGEQLVKILDFGISKVKSAAIAGRESQTVDGLVSFSPAYGAPEQWLPRRYGQTGAWTDVWGLALTMVETLKGEPVVVGDQAAMMGTIIDPGRRPTPRNEGVEVSDEVEAIFQRALAVDPRDRFSSIDAFWNGLLDALGLERRPAVAIAEPLSLPEREPKSVELPLVESVVPAAGLDHVAGRPAVVRVAGAGRGWGQRADGEIEVPRPPAVPQFSSKVQRRRQPSQGDEASRPVSRTAETEAPPPQQRSHGVRNLSLAPLSVAPSNRGPARAYPLVVGRRLSPWRQLFPSIALLVLAIAVTLLDRAYATTNGVTLSFGPLRASWLGAGCFLVALVLGASSVRRLLD